MANRYTFRPVTVEGAGEFGRKNGIFQQTKEWANFRSFYKPLGIMGFEGEEAVLSCIVYKLNIFLTPWSIGYITRGFVGDWTNRELVEEFTEYLKEFCKKKRIIYTIIDPWCDEKIDFAEPENSVRELLEHLGYKRAKSEMQPRTNYRLYLDPNNDPEEEKTRLFNRCAVKLRNDINISRDRGVTVHRFRGETLREGVKVFYNLLVETTQKKGFGHRDEDYYYRFAKELGDYVTIYLWKYDYEKDMVYTHNVLNEAEGRLKTIRDEMENPETTPQKVERLKPKEREAIKQIDALKKRIGLSEKYKDNPYISASFFIKLGNKAYNFYGANAFALRDLKLTANYWDMICDAIDGSVTTFNMGGTLKLTTDKLKEDPMYDLYLYKKQYAGEFVEMPGEYHLILDEKKYHFFHEKLNYFRRVVFRAK
ncbi:MAG: peptidoglycan bridge formation glycyltransferase FemA/FemB family protein [Clostridia bacterium]|nr:peptidoglycan bridge formation glycyltransferase FemA/FemB family protein [Clostridia bacterium]